MSDNELEFCTVHPSVETALHCNKCGRPMCVKCAVRTPVGYRCKECVKDQQKTFFNANKFDPVIQGALTFILAFIATILAGFVAPAIPFYGWLAAFFAGSFVGGGVADLAHRAAGKRRSKYGWLIVAAMCGAGALLGGLFTGFIYSLLTWGVFTFFMVSGAISRLRLGR